MYISTWQKYKNMKKKSHFLTLWDHPPPPPPNRRHFMISKYIVHLLRHFTVSDLAEIAILLFN